MLGIHLSVAVTTAGLAFLIFPAPVSWPIQKLESNATTLVGIIHSMDVRSNSLPSLHVVFSTSIVLFIIRRQRYLKLPMILWLGLMYSSVVLVHQHHVMDVIAGIALSILLFWGLKPAMISGVQLQLEAVGQ
ncbi:MAG: phosphatase PAP2 family protein [Bdellovibrionales bacterium]|nr:phosphatase PAP2 family protein [Bdellovibrionales bacterium]